MVGACLRTPASINMLFFLIGVFGSVSVSANILGLEDGNDCTALGGGQGICKLLSQCDTVGDFKTNHPPICLFKGKEIEPIICCPTKKSQTIEVEPGRKVQRVCGELRIKCRSASKEPQKTIVIDALLPPKKGNDGCGVGWVRKFGAVNQEVGNMISDKTVTFATGFRGFDNTAGVGGTEVPPRGHPYMALIGFCGNDKKNCSVSEVMWGCGGSLITQRYVLSAAHCAHPEGLGSARWAKLGDLDISNSNDDARPVNKAIVEIIVHPKYSNAQVYHDIALFRLDSDVIFNGYIMPVCLNDYREIGAQKANFTGWGRTGFAEATSDKLLEGEVDIYNETECRRLMFKTNSPKTPLGLQPDLMICAGLPDGSKDACTGDSGGPLIIGNSFNCLKTQIGITSYGHNCGLPDSPGVYTRVSNYIDWIEKVAFKDVFICD